MSKKRARKSVYIFLVLQDHVTDFVETWNINEPQEVVNLRQVFKQVTANPSYRIKTATINPIPKRLSWMRGVQVITPATGHITNKEKTIFNNVDSINFFANTVVRQETGRHLRESSHRPIVSTRHKIQTATIGNYQRDGVATLAVDGSMVPPNYCGWAVVGPTGILSIGSSQGKNKVSSNQSELSAMKSAMKVVESYSEPVNITTDSFFVTEVVEGLRTEKEKSLTRLYENATKNQITRTSIKQFVDLVKTSPHVKIVKTKGHSNDPLNNYVDAVSREAAKKMRATQLKKMSDLFLRKNMKDKLHVIHTGNFITDMWGLNTKEDLHKVIELYQPHKEKVAFITDVKGDNQWLRNVSMAGFNYHETEEKDPVMIALKTYLYKFRDMNLKLSFEEKVFYQPILLKLFLSALKQDDLIAYLYVTPEKAIVCGGWFETTIFQVHYFDEPWQEKVFYQELFDICKYTDTSTSLVIRGKSDLFKSTKSRITERTDILNKSPKTVLRKPKNGELNIYKLAQLVYEGKK